MAGSWRSTEETVRQQLEEYVPHPQPYYSFIDDEWRTVPTFGPVAKSTAIREADPLTDEPITALRLITWNIDFMAPLPMPRMAAALSHLEGIVKDTPSGVALVICLQEMVQSRKDFRTVEQDALASDDLHQIARAEWAQERFNMTDLDPSFWRCTYNSVTLVDRQLAIKKVTRLPFASMYRREALMVDVVLRPRTEEGSAAASQPGETGKESILRICNVHLESMAALPPLRPIQWKGCAKHLQDASDGVVAGILAGDCNANQDYDKTLPQENGFQDVYLELGGAEDAEEGLTWGFQSGPKRLGKWPKKRMDKICYAQADGRGVLAVKKLERIGVGVKVEDQVISEELIENDGVDFATDHYGLLADFELGEKWMF